MARLLLLIMQPHHAAKLTTILPPFLLNTTPILDKIVTRLALCYANAVLLLRVFV